MSLLPPGWKIITVDGVSTNTSGSANLGAFVFAPSQSLIVSGVEVAQSQIIAPIDPTTGAFSADLPASNDPAVSPQGTYYTVYEKFPEGRAPYAIFVDYATPGGTANLFDIAPVVPPPELVSTQGPPGNTLFAVFDIDPNTGELSVTTPAGYAGTSFSIDTNGYLGVTLP